MAYRSLFQSQCRDLKYRSSLYSHTCTQIFFFFCPLSSFFGFFIDFSLTHTHTHTPGQPRELNPGLQGELQRLIDDQDRAQAAACDGTAAVAPWVDGHFDSLPPYWYLCPYYHY